MTVVPKVVATKKTEAKTVDSKAVVTRVVETAPLGPQAIEQKAVEPKAGEPKSDLEGLLIKSVPNLRAFANSLCGDPVKADDLVQDTLVKAWTNLPKFEEGTNLRAWLFTILRNTYFSNLRKRRREVEDADGAMAERLSVLPAQHGHMDMLDFKKAFNQLTDDQKEVLVLVGAEGFSYEEAAEITGCAIGTVKSRVNRARSALTKILKLGDSEEFGSEASLVGLVASSVRATAS